MAKQATIEDIGRAIRREVGGFETATDRELMDLWKTFSADRRGRMLAKIEEANPTRTRRAAKTPAAESDAGRGGRRGDQDDQAGENKPEVGEANDESTSTVPDGPIQTDAEEG